MPMITGRAADLALFTLDAFLGGCAGLLYWAALAVWFMVPDAPHPVACITLGLIITIYARWARRVYDERELFY